jgi:hypothetical protein
MAKFNVAAIGSNGVELVVWGLGRSDDLEGAEMLAWDDVDRDEFGSDSEHSIYNVQIDADTAAKIEAGEVSVETLGIKLDAFDRQQLGI